MLVHYTCSFADFWRFLLSDAFDFVSQSDEAGAVICPSAMLSFYMRMFKFGGQHLDDAIGYGRPCGDVLVPQKLVCV